MANKTDLVANIIKFGNQNNGRDKVFRLFQYGSKLAWSNLQHNPEVIIKLKKLEASLSMTRKLLRLGKSLDFLHAALKTVHIPDVVLRLTITLSKINQAFYLLFDHLIYFHNVGLVDVDKKKWSQLSARFWIASLILNLTRNLYDIVNIINRELEERSNPRKQSQYTNGNTSGHTTRQQSNNSEVMKRCVVNHVPVWLDLVKNLSDVLLPLNGLGKVNVSPGTLGVLGVVGSLAGIATVWNPALKLVP